MSNQSPYKIIDLHYLDLPEVIACFLMETADGPVLIESGPHSCWESLTDGLARHGYSPGDVHSVLLTHIHLDHAGAAWALAEAGACVYVHPAGYPHLLDPSRLMASATRIYGEDMDRMWGDMQAIPEEQLFAVEDQQSMLIGGRVFTPHHTPGHAVHHIAWQWDHHLFCGDVAGIHIGPGVVAPPCPPPEFNLEDWLDSLRHIRNLPVEHLVLTHYGEVADKTSHLDQLEAALHQWVTFFRENPDHSDQVQLTNDFMGYIHREFYPREMDDRLREQYDNANPPWMSVAGITRYLRKQKEQE
jgi:glyoxylase-like metal-dependent hydrolase (beta-lactamase superfamily II)